MTALRLITMILAAYRASYMIVFEDGPDDIFAQLRTSIHARYGDKAWQTKGINCLLCVSFWLALPAAMLASPLGWRQLILDWLAVAGGVLIIVTQRIFR